MKLPRLYPILDTASLEQRALRLEQAAEAFLEGGAGILQLRHKGHWSRAWFNAACAVGELCRKHGALLIINDRADIALLLNAGLHIGQDDLSPQDARMLMGPDAVLGFSSHNAPQIAEADSQPVSYVAFGPVFPTRSKLNPDPVVGIEQLRRCRSLTRKPLVAIGGITRTNAREVLDAGADAVAVIGDLLPEDCTPHSLQARIRQWQRVVDMSAFV